MTSVIGQVKESVALLTTSRGFEKFARDLPKEDEQDILVNNSFVFRQGVKTNKSRFHLTLRQVNGALAPDVAVTELPTTFHKDFKLLAHHRDPVKIESLDEAIDMHLNDLGHLVFVLIGRIDDTASFTEDLGHGKFSAITLDPTQKDLVRVDGEEVIVSNTFDEERIWEVLMERTASGHADEELESLRTSVGVALDKLQDEAFAYLRLPGSAALDSNPIIGDITDGLSEQHAQYQNALDRCKGSPDQDVEAYNEVLRIAYNFASDALTFLRLLVSICDLKPIVLWGTIGERYRLVDAFRNLPWVRSHQKPSLKNYRRTISDARNSAFHDLFPFTKSLEVMLPSESLQDIRLRIFSEHSKKSQNELRFQDKELVEVLTDFTRARQRFVPAQFWRRNSLVMETTIELFESTGNYLEALAERTLKATV